MEGGGSRTVRDADASGVHIEDVGSSSELSMSIASDATIKEPKTTNAERRKARKERKAAKITTREAREKKKKEQRLKDKKKRKEARRITREARVKRRAARAQEQEKNEYGASSSELSSSSDDGDDDVSYHASKDSKKVKSKDKKKDSDDKGSNNNKNKYAAISFNYSYLSNHNKRSFINVPEGKLPYFDGTNFAKWKHLMSAYLVGLHPSLWEIVVNGLQPPKDPEVPTNEELPDVHLNGQATSILLSSLDGNEYNQVMNVNVAKQIWDTLHLAHEGVDKVRKAKIDLLMAKLNRFMIVDGKGPQEMFDRLMTLVSKIRGYGCDELDDHKVVKVMLEAYSPRNETIVTLIRDKKKFEQFTPNDVLRRLLTFDMQREEANERRRLGELQAKLEGMKIKEVALKTNKSSNQGTSNKAKGNKQASTSQPKEIKLTPQNDDPSSSSSEDEDDGADYIKIDDIALFMKNYHKGLKRNG
jgi:hypothetical protein